MAPDLHICARMLVAFLRAATPILTCVNKVLESSCMVVVEVAQHHRFDILDGTSAGGSNRFWQAVDALLPGSRRTLVDRGIPVRGHIFTAARVEEDQADVRMVDQRRDHDQVATFMFLWRKVRRPDVCSSQDRRGIAVEIAQVEQLCYIVSDFWCMEQKEAYVPKASTPAGGRLEWSPTSVNRQIE